MRRGHTARNHVHISREATWLRPYACVRLSVRRDSLLRSDMIQSTLPRTRVEFLPDPVFTVAFTVELERSGVA